MIELLLVAQTCDFGNLIADDALGIWFGVVKISFRKVSVVTVSMLRLDDRNSNPWIRLTGMQLGFPNKFGVTTTINSLSKSLCRNSQNLMAQKHNQFLKLIFTKIFVGVFHNREAPRA